LVCALVIWEASVTAGVNLADGIFRIGTDRNQSWALARSARTAALLVILFSGWYLYVVLFGFLEWPLFGAFLLSVFPFIGIAYCTKQLLNRGENQETEKSKEIDGSLASVKAPKPS
jgi:hypothetical protein